MSLRPVVISATAVLACGFSLAHARTESTGDPNIDAQIELLSPDTQSPASPNGFRISELMADAAELAAAEETPAGANASKLPGAPRTGSDTAAISSTPPPHLKAPDDPEEVHTDVSSSMNSACGHDAWTGGISRRVRDVTVADSAGSGLNLDRTYHSHFDSKAGVVNSLGWSWSHHWVMWGQPFGDFTNPYLVITPEGGIMHFHKAENSGIPGEVMWRTKLGTKERLVFHDDPPVGGFSRTGTAELYLGDGSIVMFDRDSDTSSSESGSGGGTKIDYFTARYITDPHGLRTSYEYEHNPLAADWEPDSYRLKKVVDAAGASITFGYHSTTGAIVTVTGSDGQVATYSSAAGNARLTESVAYNDGTSATYTYAPLGNGSQLQFLKTAQDTRAQCPMRSIQYDYNPSPGEHNWGEITAERHYPGGELVSAWSTADLRQHPKETRGDGPSRTFEMTKDGDHAPVLQWKQDFRGNKEYFYWDAQKYLREHKDRNGNSTAYANEKFLGKPLTITGPAGVNPDGTTFPATTTTYSYVGPGNTDPLYPYFVYSMTDGRNKTTTYSRYPRENPPNPAWKQRIYRIDYPAPEGGFEEFTYDNFGQVTRHLQKATGSGAAVYDHLKYNSMNGRLETVWNPTTSATPPSPVDSVPNVKYSYYPDTHVWRGRIQTITDQRKNQTRYEYDRRSNGIACPGRGLVTKILFPDDTHGGTFPNGTSVAFGYDEWGNKKWEQNELGQRTNFAYDDYNRLISTTKPSLPPSTINYTRWGTASSYLHTAKFPFIEISAAGRRVDYDSDADFHRTLLRQAPGTNDVASTYYHYDSNGNQDTVTDPRGKITSTAYDSRNRKTRTTLPPVTSDYRGTAPQTYYTDWKYDAVGNVATLRRADGSTESKSYDSMNRLATDQVLNDPQARITTLKYWPSGKLREVTDAKLQVTSFDYFPAIRKNTKKYHNNDTQTWDYDGAGNLVQRKTAGGTLQIFAYDERNRKTTMRWDDATIADKGDFGYDKAGRLAAADNFGVGVRRIYDAAGRLIYDRQNGPAGIKQVNYEYDADGRKTRLYVTNTSTGALVAGYDRRFDYDDIGRLEFIRDNDPAKTARFQYSYDTSSNETKRYCFWNGVAQEYGRDEINRMTFRDVKRGGVLLASDDYQYDEMNRERIVDREDGKRDRFAFDIYSGQLDVAKYGLVGDANPTKWLDYDFDKAGNRLKTSNKITNVDTNYVPNLVNQYTSSGADNVIMGGNHEIAKFKGVEYTYYGDAQLRTAKSTAPTNQYEVLYDALGRAIKRTLNSEGTSYLYDGESPIVEFKGDQSIAGTNLYGNGIDEILMRADYVVLSAGQGYFYQQDRLGNVTHLTSFGGTTIEKYSYDAFGAPTTTFSGGSFNNRFKFTGREHLPAFSVYEYRARIYHTGLGRFMSEDPRGFDAGDYNLFRYCGNDPLDKTDPMGLEEVTIELRSFIPQKEIGGLAGDNRSFSASPSAGFRTSVTVRIETDPSRNGGKVLLSSQSKISPSTNTRTGESRPANAILAPTVTASRDSNGNSVVNVEQNVRTGFQPVANGIRSNVNISVNQSATAGNAAGTLSRAPAFEANVTPNGGSTTNVPLQDSTATKLVPFFINLQRTDSVRAEFRLEKTGN